MPRNAATTIENTFVGGFVTQATALNFPDHAAFDQDNVVFSERGIASRRFGFDFENNFVQHAYDQTEKSQTTYYWRNAGGDGNTNIVVHQNGGVLYFYETTANSLSAGAVATPLALSAFQSAGATSDNLDQNECQFSTGLGYLFVTHSFCDPFYVKRNPDGTYGSSIITFQIRDVTGIDENVLVDDRPSILTPAHGYNLYNQGWDTTKITTFYTAAGSKYPSNADVWWIYKDSTDVYNPATTLASNSRGSTPAPKGFIRLNPWNTQRAASLLSQAGANYVLTAADETSGTVRPSCTAFHSGRVFYAGVNAQGYTNRIYFSKIVQKPMDFGQCMSEDDPTSETLFDFLPSDGGIISIPEAGTIYKLVSLGTTMIVFGANGVWAISGSTGVGFAATDYTVSFVGETKSISGSSFVSLPGAVAWWNATGINMVQNDPQKGPNIVSMTDEKIKDFYVAIPGVSKRYAKGTYNPRTHVIQWVYGSQAAGSITENYEYDRVLSFNTLVGAFYTWTNPGPVQIEGIVTIDGAASLTGQETITDNLGNVVTDNALDPLITYGFSQTDFNTVTKFLCWSGGKVTFGECFNVSYLDWTQNGVGVDYNSYFITGYQVKTQGQRKFTTNYIHIFTDLEDGLNSYRFQALWNYGNTGNSGQWTQKQTVSQDMTHAETNYDAGRRRLKVRGSGTAVQYKFQSVSGLPFNIIGWSTYDTANAST